VRAGQIWSAKHEGTGKVVGWRVIGAFIPRRPEDGWRPVAWMKQIKAPNITYCFVLTPEGIPMRLDGTASPNWHLIEDVP